MTIDVLVLNTAVTDLRSDKFEFASKLVGPGGLAKCATKDMLKYSQEQFARWIREGKATAGGPGNSAPLMARAGLKVGIHAELGAEMQGADRQFSLQYDAQGKFWYQSMSKEGIDMSTIHMNAILPTGTTFIHDTQGGERGGIAYFPNANNQFSFIEARRAVERLAPKIVYYMYSGLSDSGDANAGRDLAEFMAYCRKKGIVTIADAHTLTGKPLEVIASGKPVAEYKLLEPLLPELDIFFTSADEARMISNTLVGPHPRLRWNPHTYEQVLTILMIKASFGSVQRTKLFGITKSDGAQYHISTSDHRHEYGDVPTRFMAGNPIDLVGAGDAFRAGLLAYLANNLQSFKDGTLRHEQVSEAVQMGNLFASLFIKAPLDDRYGSIPTYDRALAVVRNGKVYENPAQLQNDLGVRLKA